MSGFYRSFNILGGLAYDGSAHHQFGFPMSGRFDPAGNPVSGGIDWIHGLASAPDNPTKLYAWAVDPSGSNAFVYLSSDSGATWTRQAQFPGRNGQVPDGNGTATASAGQVWVANHTDNSFTARRDGIWRSADDGATWTRILPCEGTLTRNTFASGGNANNVNVSEVMSGPGIGPGIYGIMASPVATDLEFHWTAGSGSNWTVRLLDTAGTTVITTFPLGTGTSGVFHRTDIATWYASGARQFGFSTSAADTLTGPASTYKSLTTATSPRGCVSSAFGASKLWFCWEPTGSYSDTNYPFPPQGQATYRVEQANPDGSGRTTINDVIQYASSDYNTSHDNRVMPLRVWGDTYVLIPSAGGQPNPPPAGSGMLWRVDAGGVTQIVTPGGPPLDALPLGPTTWLVLTQQASPTNTATIYRTDNAGTTWSLIRVLTFPDYAGVAAGNFIAADGAGNYLFAAIAGSNDVYLAGGQGTVGPGAGTPAQNAPLVTWFSTDLGVNWSAIADTTAPVDNTGAWMNGLHRGICPGAAPPPTPTAVGANLVSIVG